MCNPLLDYYRCPEAFAKMGVQEHVASSAGFFRFDKDAVCYGRSPFATVSSHPNGNLVDTWTTVRIADRTAILPFDPEEVVDNLRNERYMEATTSNTVKLGVLRSCRATYYRLRPILPFSIRSYIKKAYLAGWKKIAFPRWPVDVSVDHLLKSLLKLSLNAQGSTEMPFIWFWPEGFKSCLIMTHDVETEAGLDLIDFTMDLDESVGINASFQLIPEGRYAISEALLGRIRTRGFEVNIHDLNHDGRLFDDREDFTDRAQKINYYLKRYGAAGYRSGALYRNQDWYGAFAFEYDMSVPNVAHLDPQHGGCCTVMPYFIGDIVELPLTTIQDYFLFYILEDYSINLWKQQLEIINQQHGLMSFIIHPDYLVSKQSYNTFKALLGYLVNLRRTEPVWFALPGDVNRWWRQRSTMCLVRHGSEWKIEGEGSERARLAFAHLRDGGIEYRIS